MGNFPAVLPVKKIGHEARFSPVLRAFHRPSTAGIPLLLESSVKAGLDLQWENPGAVAEGLGQLVEQLDSLQAWVEQELPDAAKKPPLHKHLQTLAAIRTQDLEPDPTDPSRSRIRQGTARDRRISIEDSQMRHGRKSQSYKFNGFKRTSVRLGPRARISSEG